MEDDIEILMYNMSRNISEVMENIVRNKLDMDKLTKNEKSRLKIFEEYMDLNATYQSIKNCLIYINSFPFYPRVAKVDYLKFIYSAYLNEIYILQSRISKLTKTIKRCLKEYKEEAGFNIDFNIIDNCTNNAVNRFKKIIEVRGAHVHVKRYTTKNIDNVENYEFISILSAACTSKPSTTPIFLYFLSTHPTSSTLSIYLINPNKLLPTTPAPYTSTRVLGEKVHSSLNLVFIILIAFILTALSNIVHSCLS